MKKVLVVDDDDFVRMVMVQALQSAGHETDESPDGTDAIAKLSLNKYDLVVTDVVMPEESGVSVAAYIKKNKLPTPVLAVSSHSNGDNSGSVLDFATYFADDTMRKPFRKEQFLETVNRLSACVGADIALENL